MRLKFIAICLTALLFAACKNEQADGSQKEASEAMTEKIFDWQGHRGARGLLPENTVPAFLLALEYPKVKTLELDVAVSKDGQLIVSHEPWLSEHICSWPDGRPVTAAEADSLAIYQHTAAEIQAFDCGSRGNERFPEQQAMKVHKPKLSEVVQAAEQRARDMKRRLPWYNIEIKSQPEWDGTKTPDPEAFARLLLTAIEQLGIKDRSCIQSFDPRALEAVHQQDEQIVTAYLIENLEPAEDNLAKLSFTPTIYSPYYMLVTANLVTLVHERGMQLIPWTVNDKETMQAMIALGVDGIITDYPDRIP